MQKRSRVVRRLWVVPALFLLGGCAEHSTTSQQPFATDHWEANAKFTNAGVDSVSHDASLFVGCIPVVAGASLLVLPASPMSVEPAQRLVTITLDNGPRFEQSWFSTKGEYGISDDEAGYSELISMMKIHQSVEIVLHDSGKEIDRHSFTLKGAAAAIDATLAACGRKPIPAPPQ